MPVRIPKYRHHKPTGQALVEIGGHRYYLGPYDSQQRREEYRRMIAEYLSGNPSTVGESTELTVAEAKLRYIKFAKSYNVKDGKPTDELAALKAILKRLCDLYGRLPASQFGPKAYRTLRDTLVRENLSRNYINDSMSLVGRMFR